VGENLPSPQNIKDCTTLGINHGDGKQMLPSGYVKIAIENGDL
jgi:hypothetical protein